MDDQRKPILFGYSCGALGTDDEWRCQSASPKGPAGSDYKGAAISAGWHICRSSLVAAKRGYPDLPPHGAACPEHAPVGACVYCAAVEAIEAAP